jgi:hypothetical protein
MRVWSSPGTPQARAGTMVRALSPSVLGSAAAIRGEPFRLGSAVGRALRWLWHLVAASFPLASWTSSSGRCRKHVPVFGRWLFVACGFGPGEHAGPLLWDPGSAGRLDSRASWVSIIDAPIARGFMLGVSSPQAWITLCWQHSETVRDSKFYCRFKPSILEAAGFTTISLGCAAACR